MAAWAVIPFNDFLVVANVNAGLLFVMAVTSISVYGIILAGWASNSKYAFLGAMRSAAQMISYEVAIGLVHVVAGEQPRADDDGGANRHPDGEHAAFVQRRAQGVRAERHYHDKKIITAEHHQRQQGAQATAPGDQLIEFRVFTHPLVDIARHCSSCVSGVSCFVGCSRKALLTFSVSGRAA